MSSKRSRSTGSRHPGRPPKLTPEHVEILKAVVREDPVLSLDDLVSAFRQKTGMTVSTPTVRKYLLAAGFERWRLPRSSSVAPVAAGPGGVAEPAPPVQTYGYGPAHRDRGDRVRYPCGLTDSEWEQVQAIFDPPRAAGRPPKYPRRQMLDACIYVLRSGCSWRMLPKDFPPWDVVYRTFRRWLARGLFEQMYDALRKLWRSRQRRAPDPTGAILDSQSVTTSPQGGPKGYDAAKKIKGRKRHLVTDTLGLLLAVLVTAASTQDRDAAMPVLDLAKAKVPGIKKLWVDSGYAGQRARQMRENYDLEVEVVRHPASRSLGRWHQGQIPLWEMPKGFVVLPKRWIIERTNAWNLRPRRMNKDHDRSLAVATGWIWLAEGRRLLRRLTTADLPITE